MTTAATAAVPAMYHRNGFDMELVADLVPIGALALVRGTDVMEVKAHADTNPLTWLTDALGRTHAMHRADVQPVRGTDERHHFDIGHGFGAWLRTGEVLLRFCVLEGALCATRQQDGSRCRKPLAMKICCWDRRITDTPKRPGQWKLGEDAFGGLWLHHADGSPCGEPHHDGQRLKVRDSVAIPRCPECHQYDTLRTDLQAYGDRTTCTTSGCGYDFYYPIGD